MVADRLSVWGTILWRPLFGIIYGILGVLGTLTLIRDNFLPPNVRAQLQILNYLPSWSLLPWLGFTLLCVWALTLEGAYRLVSEEKHKIQKLETKLKAKYEREEIIARLRECVAQGYQLIVKVEDYKDTDVRHVFDREDDIETWVMDVYRFLIDGLPQHATAFLGDFEKFRKDWGRRRTDSQYRAMLEIQNITGQIGKRQFWGNWIKDKIAQVEDFMSSL